MIGPLLPSAWVRLLPRLLDLAGGARTPTAASPGAPSAPPGEAADPQRAVHDIVPRARQGPLLLNAIVETTGGPRRLVLEAQPAAARPIASGNLPSQAAPPGPTPAVPETLAAARYLRLAGGGEAAPAQVQGLDALGRLLIPFRGILLRSVLPAPGIAAGQACRVLLPAGNEPEPEAAGPRALLQEQLRRALAREGTTGSHRRAPEPQPDQPSSQPRGQDAPAGAGAAPAGRAEPAVAALLGQAAALLSADPDRVEPRLILEDAPEGDAEQGPRRSRLVVTGTLPALGDYLVVLECAEQRYDVRILLAADPGAEARRDIADLIGAGCELGRALGRLEVTAGDLAPQDR